ncbi:unnamed protein product, partial [Musa acuminata subsp. burmannicoides]
MLAFTIGFPHLGHVVLQYMTSSHTPNNIREKSWLMAGVFSKYKLNPLLRTISRQLAIRNGT